MEEILHQWLCSVSHYLQYLIDLRWCRISSINSMYIPYLPITLLHVWTQTWHRSAFSRQNRPLFILSMGRTVYLPTWMVDSCGRIWVNIPDPWMVWDHMYINKYIYISADPSPFSRGRRKEWRRRRVGLLVVALRFLSTCWGLILLLYGFQTCHFATLRGRVFCWVCVRI